MSLSDTPPPGSELPQTITPSTTLTPEQVAAAKAYASAPITSYGPNGKRFDNFDALPWEKRLRVITRIMREVSSITDPMQMVDVYGEWMQSINPIGGFIS